MRIAVATDGSKASVAAARHVAELARNFAEPPSVFLIFVDEPLLKQVALSLGVEGVRNYHAESAKHAIRPCKPAFRRIGLDVTERSLIGDPATEILKTIKKDRCDLLVMGSHGRGALKSLFLGSVSVKVIGHASIPVTVVRG